MLNFVPISADSHVVEPGDLWSARLDARYRDRAPVILRNEGATQYSNSDGLHDYYYSPESKPHTHVPVGFFAQSDIADSKDIQINSGLWDLVPKGAYDPVERRKDMDRDGVQAEVLFTSAGLILFSIADLDFQYACTRVFNDWLAEFCSAMPDRLFATALITPRPLDRAIAEMERCKKMGFVGAVIPMGQEDGSWADPEWDRLWAAASDLEMPICMHVIASETSFASLSRLPMVNQALAFTPAMYAITEMMVGGVFDRYPKLKLLSVENDASWAAGVLSRMDYRVTVDEGWLEGANAFAEKSPTEVFQGHVGLSFMCDPAAVKAREIIGVNNLLWGSDYPHFDGCWPNSQSMIARQFEGVPLADQIRIGRANAIEFYGLPIAP